MIHCAYQKIFAVIFLAVLLPASCSAGCFDNGPGEKPDDDDRKDRLLRLARSAESRAYVRYADKEYHATEEYLKLAMKLYLQIDGSKSTMYVACVEQLARYYVNIGNYSSAHRHFLEVLQYRKEKYAREPAAYYATLQELANLYGRMGRLTLADHLMQSVVDFYRGRFGTEDPRFLLASMELGLINVDLGNHQKADRLFKLCLKISENLYGTESLEYADSLQCRARLSAKMGNLDQARGLFDNVLKIQKEKLTSDKLITIELQLCSIYLRSGENRKASNLLKEIGKEFYTLVDEDEMVLLATHVDDFELLGFCHVMNNTLQDAKYHYRKAMVINERVRGCWHPRAVRCLEGYSIVLQRQDRHIEAMCLQQQIEVYRLCHTIQECIDRAWIIANHDKCYLPSLTSK